MTAPADLEDVRRLVSLLWREGDVFELRGLVKVNGQQHVTFGFFDDREAFARAAADRSGKDAGVYFTINPANPALLARAPKNKVRRAGVGDTTSDKDVLQRRALLVDVDAVRPAGISATDAEHTAAIALVRKIRDELAVEGWPAPLLGDSGNGGHLVYAVDLPIADGGLVERVLKALHKRFGCEADGVVLKVDTTVHNPARISKIYGTLTRKGEDTPERPHRLARILEAPEQLAVVSREQLEAFAPIATPTGSRATSGPKATPPTRRATFDLMDWIAKHVPDAREREWASGRRWLIPVCPFNESHAPDKAFIVQFPSGAVEAKCQHESCFKSWEELRVKFEPDAYDRRGNGNGTRTTDREPPPWIDDREVLFEDPRFEREIARAEEMEIDGLAARDREEPAIAPTAPAPAPTEPPPWRFGPELVDRILERAKDPWISLMLLEEEIARVRAGGTVVVIGSSGSGKTSLVACMLVQHARDVGPAIALSIELPDEEFAARIVGQKCDASWEDALRGKIPELDMRRVLELPRLCVLERRRATIANLERAVDECRRRWPGQPILVAIDYAQLLESKEREVRMRVADAFAQIDDCAREKRFVAIALSQMSRMSTTRARSGEAIGAESAALGAETAAIERFATMTLAIGLAAPREDGSEAVELSVGKARMSKGDRVLPMTYWGRTGLWRVAGDSKTAGEVREHRDVVAAEKLERSVQLKLVGAAASSSKPLSRNQLIEMVAGDRVGRVKVGKSNALKAIVLLIDKGKTGEPGGLVEIAKQAPGSRKSSPAWLLWTEDRARAAGAPLVRDTQLGGIA